MKTINKIILLFFVVAFSDFSFAGPVGVSGGFTVADMNSQGDYLLLGDRKVNIKVNGKIFGRKLPGKGSFRYSANIAERAAGDFMAILCTPHDVFLYHSETTPEFPTGSLQAIPRFHSTSSKAKNCAMTKSGNYAILSSGKIYINGDIILNSPVGKEIYKLVAAGDQFIAVTALGKVFAIVDSQIFNAASSVGYLTRYTAVTADDQRLFIADDYGVRQYLWEISNNQLQIKTGNRLAVSPCSEQQVCGMHIASDKSLLVSGYWGSWLIKDDTKKRIRTPSFSGEYGAVGFAHSASEGVFIYSGSDDGDYGSLTNLISRSNENNGFIPPKFSKLPKPEDKMRILVEEPWWSVALDKKAIFEKIDQQNLQLEDVKVGIVDTGMDMDHPWLRSQLWQNPGEYNDNRDSDNNGFVNDISGYDFVDEDSTPQDEYGHGTHVAGLLGARTPDGEAWTIARNSKLIIARALDAQGKSNSLDLARAIHYLLDQGVKAINCSWGGGGNAEILKSVFARANKMGVPIFTSAGNDGLNINDNPPIPSIYPGVISIGSLDRQLKRSSSSNYGSNIVKFMAPGSNIMSTIRGGGLGEMSGTSMASPIALSVLVLHMGLAPSLDSMTQLERLCKVENGGQNSICGFIRASF